MRAITILPILFTLLMISCNTSPGKKTENKTQKDQYLIVFNVLVDPETDNYDIWTLDPGSGEKKNITNHPDVAWAYSAYSNMIFFLSDRDTSKRTYFLYEMDQEGKQIRKITEFPLRDSWMSSRKSGSELIVNPHPEVDSVFYIINRKGEIITKIHHGLTFASDPAFSPDGSRIAFRGANQRSKRDPGFDEDLYQMNTDGSGLLRLTIYPKSDTTAPWYAYRAGPPQWHPSGDFISYQSFQNGKYSLYAVSPDGSGTWKLTETQQEEGWHMWSPDGNTLAVELFDQNQTQFHIGLLDWESKALRILTDTTFKYQQAPLFVKKAAARQ